MLLSLLDGSGSFLLFLVMGGKWALFFHIRAALLHIQSDCFDDVLDIMYARIFPDDLYDFSNIHVRVREHVPFSWLFLGPSQGHP